ncbi:hypothetical protein [Hydrogenophaga laconesensis]|uniref:Uncharacterized protein n=1 Tax=Hydrogenophaga laconesensis TaxID=1805971 RepID=A0ABU1VEX9_9BURK|nr:hypothetical protein [Hydrogenophaga laconesensis]MDR7095895.1 hypothetical protein [Hydrogenophaga laconesensis]
MNRCRPAFAATLIGLSTMLTAALVPIHSAQAQAVQRSFPAKALRGTMVVSQPPLLTMDDRATRFAPGARILDSQNKIVMSATLINQEVVVNYTLDQRGQVHQVWVLTEAEAKEKRAGYGTQRNFVFESQQASPAGTPARTTN